MKRSFLILPACVFCAITLTFFTACPPLFPTGGGNSLSDFTLKSAEELVAYMNDRRLDENLTFSLIGTTSDESGYYKIRTVKMSASTLPGKTITAHDFIGAYDSSIPESARTSIIFFQEKIVTDYYAIKFEEAANAYFSDLYSPIVGSAEHTLLVTPCLDYQEAKPYADFDEYKKDALHFFDCRLVVKKSFTEEEERTYNELCYKMRNSEQKLDSTTGLEVWWSPDVDIAAVSDESLADGTFLGGNDGGATKKTFISLLW